MKRWMNLIALACLLVGDLTGLAQGTNASPKPAPAAAVQPAPVPAPAPNQAVPAAQPAPPAPASVAPTNVAPAAVTAPAASNAPARTIRFQFEGIPYMDVIERFAQMVDKPLVANTNIQGSLAFNDPRPYTYAEALETLNLMLSMKGVMLVESGHYLQLVPLKELPQMPLRILRGSEATGDVSLGEVVTVVLEVKNLDSKEVGEAVVSMLSNAGSVAPLSRGRGLIITDRLANIQRVRSLLAAIDTEALVERQMRTFTLLHASGAIVADLLNRTFGVATAPKRTQFNPQTKQLDVLPADPNDYITAVFDEASRTLVLFGPRERVALAEDLISRFEQKEGGAGDVRIYYPQLLKPDQLAEMLRQAVSGIAAPGETAAAAATKARLIVDSPQARLIVAAPIPGQLDTIENFINSVDRPVHGKGTPTSTKVRSETIQLTRVFRPRNADVATVAKILTDALSKRLPSGAVLPSANVAVETNSQSVVVTGAPGEVQVAADIVSQLETGSLTPRSQQTKFLEVGTLAEAKRLLPLVEQIYRSQVADGLGGQMAHAKIVADPEAGRLIVTASDEHLQRIEQIVTQLRAEKPKPPARRLQILALKHLRIDTALANLTSLVNERMADKRFEDLPKPLLVSDATNNRLLVTATDDQLREIEQIVNTLDVAPTKAARETRVLTLNHLRADTGLTSLNNLVNERLTDKRFDGLPKPSLVPDAANNRLFVTATPEQLLEIEQALTLLDVAPTKAARETRVLAFKHLRVDTGLTSLNNLVNERLTDKRFDGLPKPSLVPDAANNRLLVTATPEQMQEIEQALTLLDVAPDKARREMMLLPIQSKSAAEIMTLASQLLTQLGDEQPNPQLAPKLIPDPSGKQIIALATPSDMGRITNLIHHLDTAASAAATRQFRGIELYSRTATELTPLVTQLYQEQLKGVAEPAGGPATLIAEPRNNRIMVSGTEREIARVEAVIRTLDPESKKGTKEETRVIRLKAALAAELAALVEKSLNVQSQQIKVLVDARSNSLVVSGDSAAVEAASAVIQQLDTRSDITPREMRILDLRSGEAGSMAGLVTSLFTEMVKDQRGPEYVAQSKITPDATGNRLIVTGPKEELALVSGLVQQLDQLPEQGGGARIFKLNTTDALSLVSVVSNAMLRFDNRGQPVRKVTIAADDKSNSLIVTGSRADLQDAAVIVERLDGSAEDALGGPGLGAPSSLPSGKTRELKILEVNTSEPDQLAALALRVFAAQNLGRNLTNLLSITPDPTGKRMVVLASPALLPQVEKVITALDTPAEQGARELHSIELKNATASELLSNVTRIYAEQTQGKTTKPATLYPDASGTRFAVYGTRDQAAQIRQIVETLESQKRVPRETKVFEFARLADAQRIMPLAQQLYRDQLTSQPAAGPADAQFITDGRSGRLIVLARQDHLQQIEEIVTRLQAGLPTNQLARETRSFDVGTPGDVQRLLPLVQQLYQDQWKDRLETDPADAQIVGDAKSGRIVVSGKPEHVRQIEAILQQLGVGKARPETRDSRQTRIYDLTTASAVELATTVRALYLDQSKTRLGTLTPDTLIQPDAGANRLIVVGEAEELAVVEDIVQKLDKVSAQSASARVFRLKSADPAKVAEILTTALVRYDAYGRPQKRISVSVDAKSRTLIATGDPKELQGVSVIIEQLDASLGAQAERKMKVVTLKQGRATELSTKLRQLYNDHLTSQPELGTTDILIMEDTPSNQLILTGSDAQLALLDRILGDLQAAQVARGARETRMIDIGQADELTRLQPLVQQLYQERWRDQTAGDPPDAQIMSDTKNARFIVTARTNHIAEIEAIIAQLRAGATNQPRRDTRIYDLTTANASELASTVRSLYQEQARTRPGVVPSDTMILPDNSANRLIVTGATNELDVVEEIIKKLDKVSAQSGTVRLFKLKSADPSKVMEILGNALTSYDSYGRMRRRVGVTVDAKTRTIIVAGDPKELQSLQNAAVIIEQLDNALGQQAERQIKVVTLKQSKVAELLPKVRQLYNDQLAGRPDLAVTEVLMLEDTPGNQLILTGSEAQLELVEKIIQELQAAQVIQGPRETRMIEIGQTDEMQRLLPLVEQLYKERWKDRAAGDPVDAQIIADAKNARFIVTARTNHIAEIERITQQLRGGQPLVPRDTRIVDLTTANAVELAATVKALYQDQLKARPSPPAAEAAIVPDVIANRLVLSGPTNELDVVEELVKKLDKVGAQSASVRVFKLKSAEPDKVLEILQTAMVRYDAYGRVQKRVSVSVDPKSRTLIMTGDPKELQGASLIIEQLDSIGGQPERRMRVLPVKTLKVSDLMTKLRAVYDDQVKAEPELGVTDVLMLPDATSNQLVLAGNDNQLKLIEEIATQLETSALVQEPRETRVYELSSSSAQELAATVKSLYQEQIKSQPTSPASQALVLPDANANRLIVSATTNDLKLIDDIIQKIDKTDAQTGRTRVFRLKQAEAEQVAMILSTALVQFTPSGRNVPRVSVGTDPQNNLLIVSGNPPDLQAAAVIVEEMDTIMAREPRQMRIVPLKSGLATEVSTRIKQLYIDQMKGRPKTGAADAVVLGDDVANRLIITASESHMKVIEQIVSQLQEAGEGAGRQLRVFPMQRNSATSVAAMATQLFSRQVASTDPAEKLIVTSSPDDRTLVVECAGRTLEKVEQLVKTLDGEELKGIVEVRTYQMPEGNAADLADTLARLFAERGGRAQGGLAPRFEGDPQANVLMVAATKPQFDQIEKLIEEMKKTAAVANEIRTFKLQYGDPQQVADVLDDMLASAEGSRIPGTGRRRFRPWTPGGAGDVKTVRVAPAVSLNAVVVQGPPEKLALAEKLIATLDKLDIEGRAVIQTVHLKKAHAEDLADSVTKSITARGPQSRLHKVSVTPVVGPNSLLINGPTDAVEEVLKIIRDLDQESSDDEIEVRIYKLENGQAKEVSTILNQILQNVTRAQARTRGSARLPQATVTVDERANRLIISAARAHFKVVDQLLPLLDKVPERSDRDVFFVWLKNARAVDVAPTLEAVFAGRPEADRPVVEPDLFANSITVIGTKADVAQIQDLVARLDAATKDTSIQVRLRPLDSVPADQMARMLQNIYPQMAEGRIRVVDKLQPPPAQDKSRPGAAPTNAPAPPPSAQTNETPPPPLEVVIAVDKDANALLLSGPGSELDQIDRIISDLTFSFISTDAEFRLFPLKEADPIVVARTLNDLFKVEQVRVEQPAQRPGEVRTVTPPPKITVVAEPRTRSVIVRAKPTDFTLLESLIKQLDSQQLTAQIDYRVVPLTNAQPQKVLLLVQQMVGQLNLARPGEPLTVSVDARARGILVVARDTLINQIEKMVRSLDVPSDYAEAEVRVIPLKKASAPQLALVLQGMLQPSPAAALAQVTPEARELQEQVRRLKIINDAGQPVQLDLTKPIKVMADPLWAGASGGNRLILTSTPDNLKALSAVVEMMDTVPVLEGVDVRIVRLQHADATSLAQTLNTIFTQAQRLLTAPGGAPGQPEGDAGKALAKPTTVAVDARHNALILSGQKEALELALKIIDDLDRDVERFVTEVRLFQIRYASATRLMPLLMAVFAEGPPVPGLEGLNTYVTRLRTALDKEGSKTTELPKTRAAIAIQADEPSNLLIVAARSDVLPLIGDVIKQLDIPHASGLNTVRIIPLKHADPSVIQKVIQDLHSGSRAAHIRPEDRPTISIDERTSALIVAASEKTFAIIDSLLASLDRDIPPEFRDIRIVPLENADAGEVASQLQRLMDARVTQKSSLGRQQAEALRVLIIGDPRSNSLLIGGSQDSFELVRDLALQLDRAEPALSGRIRLVPLQYADARALVTSLNTLFAQRYQTARTPEMQRKRPIIVADPRGNSLLIAAGVDDNQTIDDLLLKLDRKVEDPSMILTVIPLKHNDCTRVAPSLEAVFQARQRNRTVPGVGPLPLDMVDITTDPLNNSLIVYASKENLELIRGLLDKIDVEPSIYGGTIQTFTLQRADANRVANILRSLVDQGLYRPGAPAPATAKTGTSRDALAVTVDPRSNTLIVSASPENLAIIKTVIEQVDTKDFAEMGNVRLYTLKHARASSLSTVLEQFFRAKRAGEAQALNAAERSVPLSIVPDDRSNTLLITGSKEGLEVADRLVQQLDGEDVMARMNFRVFPLKQATASKLQDTLTALFTRRPARVRGEPAEPITLVADAWANALIVGASVEDMSMVASLIEKLDSEEGGSGTAVQVLPLAKADARRVAQTIQSLYREGAPGAALPVAVSADERINGLVVSAGENDLKRIAELVKKLDTDQVARVAEIRVFALKYARAEALSGILNTSLNTRPTPLTEQSPNTQSLLQFITRTDDGQRLVTSALKESVLITPDNRMNSLIVSAPLDYMGLLEQIITRLDNSSHQKAKIKVFALINADARQTAELLTTLFRLQQVGAPPPGQRSIQYTLVKPIDPDIPSQGEEAVASAVLGTDEQSALTVTVDPRTNSLLVGGTEEYVALVSEIINALDSSEALERRTEVYRLKNAQAVEVSTAIRNFLDQERQRVTQVLGQEAVGTAQRLLEREVAIVAEPTSNTLLLSANPRYFEEIAKLIQQLDHPQEQVLIQVLVAEVSLDEGLEVGLEWTYNGIPYSAGIEVDEAKWISSGFSSAVTGGNYSFLFRALENQGRLEVLSRPQIVTGDNKAATINIGQRIPLITDSRVTERGDTINSFRYENVGVNLTVTPRIAPDGFVQMEIGTTNSVVSSSSVEINKNATVPIINERRANTTVSVQSGQTILIGGLIATVDDKRTKKVPVLGDIPGLGMLFRSAKNAKDRKELIILLTPQIIAATDTNAVRLTPTKVTQDQLQRSTIKDEIQRDKLQKQLLDPLFPEELIEQPMGRPGRPSPSPKAPNTKPTT